MDDAQHFGKSHLIPPLLPKGGAVAGEIAGKASAEVNQLLPSWGEAEQGCSDTIPPTPALRLVPARVTCPRCAQQLPQRCPLEVFSGWGFGISQSVFLEWERGSPHLKLIFTGFFSATSAPGIASYRLGSKRLQFKGQHMQQVYRSPNDFKYHLHHSRRHQVHKR